MIKLLEYIQMFGGVGDVVSRIRFGICVRDYPRFSIQTRNNNVIIDYLSDDNLHIKFTIKIILDNSIQFHEISIRDQLSYRQIQMRFKELCQKEERLYLYQGERLEWYCDLCSYYLREIRRGENNECFKPEYIKSLLYETP